MTENVPIYSGKPDPFYFMRRLYGSDGKKGLLLSVFAGCWVYWFDQHFVSEVGRSSHGYLIFMGIGVLNFLVGFLYCGATVFGYLKGRFQYIEIFSDRVDVHDKLPFPKTHSYSIVDLNPRYGMSEERGYWSWVFAESFESSSNALLPRKDSGLFGVEKGALELIQTLKDRALLEAGAQPPLDTSIEGISLGPPEAPPIDIFRFPSTPDEWKASFSYYRDHIMPRSTTIVLLSFAVWAIFSEHYQDALVLGLLGAVGLIWTISNKRKKN